MNDLISRQEAAEEFKTPGAVFTYGEGTCKAIISRLMLVPPAHPGRWIPVKERLPEDGQWCLVTDGKRVSVERYKVDIIDHFWPSPRWFNVDKMVAWMPLPEPYKEG